MKKEDFKKINDYLWEVPESYRGDMRVPARIYADEETLEAGLSDRSYEQLVNSTTLPGVEKYALAMPDVHEGYGVPIGFVGAMRADEGVISPGAIGYDINCGVRLLRSALSKKDIAPHIVDLANQLQRDVPSGVGRGGEYDFAVQKLDRILEKGVPYLVEQGYGTEEDIKHCEEGGAFSGADPTKVSRRAKQRGSDQAGTLGAGNHFLEVERVDEVFDKKTAEEFGLFEGQVVVFIHTGSRGLGHQIATDYLKVMMGAMQKYDIHLPDRELASAPFRSREGQDYWQAMQAGGNFAFANRQMITHIVRNSWQRIMGKEKLELVYDVAHNTAKLEKHETMLRGANKYEQELVVHRKGATRAFPDQPVFIPGSMGTGSYVLAGTEQGMKETFGSAPHGSGRTMSRHAALKQVRGEDLKRRLEEEGIVIRGESWKGLAEEAPRAYKDIEKVAEIAHQAGFAKKVARMKPLAVIKG